MIRIPAFLFALLVVLVAAPFAALSCLLICGV